MRGTCGGLAIRHPDYFMPDQFSDFAAVEAHRRTTAREILEQTGGSLRAPVTGMGIGGTITGVGGVLREEAPGCWWWRLSLPPSPS